MLQLTVTIGREKWCGGLTFRFVKTLAIAMPVIYISGPIYLPPFIVKVKRNDKIIKSL